ncbi:hypothetical protein [Terrabacter sp. Root85]|uniref:hypothetical protein n=1 Tax=Terrabacter sp. Root85 TaxID=1736603 RepID=UPI0021007909|nr:hypothetical protein [Terrabacter sp. Root85]
MTNIARSRPTPATPTHVHGLRRGTTVRTGPPPDGGTEWVAGAGAAEGADVDAPAVGSAGEGGEGGEGGEDDDDDVVVGGAERRTVERDGT